MENSAALPTMGIPTLFSPTDGDTPQQMLSILSDLNETPRPERASHSGFTVGWLPAAGVALVVIAAGVLWRSLDQPSPRSAPTIAPMAAAVEPDDGIAQIRHRGPADASEATAAVSASADDAATLAWRAPQVHVANILYSEPAKQVVSAKAEQLPPDAPVAPLTEALLTESVLPADIVAAALAEMNTKPAPAAAPARKPRKPAPVVQKDPDVEIISAIIDGRLLR